MRFLRMISAFLGGYPDKLVKPNSNGMNGLMRTKYRELKNLFRELITS
jgi:hypothetical protein